MSRWKAKELTRSDSFQTWLEFTPGGGLYVPLGYIEWSWGATAILVGTNVVQEAWMGTNLVNSPSPSYVESEHNPFWTNTIGAFMEPMDFRTSDTQIPTCL